MRYKYHVIKPSIGNLRTIEVRSKGRNRSKRGCLRQWWYSLGKWGRRPYRGKIRPSRHSISNQWWVARIRSFPCSCQSHQNLEVSSNRLHLWWSFHHIFLIQIGCQHLHLIKYSFLNFLFQIIVGWL